MSSRIALFDTWQAGYAGASVAVYVAGTSALAALYRDEDLTIPTANPQKLLSLTQDGVHFGKFANPIYTASAYSIRVNSRDESGIIRPGIESLMGEDASGAVVTPAGGTQATALDDILGRAVDVCDHGAFLPTSDAGASSSTNSATLAAAIGVAAAAGGGYVELPSGTFAYTTIATAANVIIRGKGDGVTVLQSVVAATVATVGGDRSGFCDLTLDGVSKQAGSTGVYSKAKNAVVLRRVTVKRFETGIHQRGAQRNAFSWLNVNNCATGVKFHGDDDAGGGADGEDFWFNRWDEGLVSECTTIGVELSYVDRICWHNEFSHVGFEDNTGTALNINGARHTRLANSCWFDGNTDDIAIRDGTEDVLDGSNEVVGFFMDGGRIQSDMTFVGRCQDVVFRGVEFNGGTYTLTAPDNQILVVDCIESSNVELAGTDTTKWARVRSTNGDAPSIFGLTTNNTATMAWSYNIAPGERVHVEAVVVANGRNVNHYAMYHIARSAHRPPSTLAYEGQTGNFTTGLIVTGATSGATARIVADSDSGATGTLSLKDITGVFQDNEIIADTSSGSATVNGTITDQNAALLGSTTSIETAVESDASCACDFAVSGDEVRVNVTGVTSKTLEWTVSARVTSGG